MWFSRPKPQPEAPFFVWSDADHSVGLSVFDREHKHLAALVSKVHATLKVDRDRVLAQKLMETLIQETRAHFVHEEKAMAEAGYPDLEAHAELHAALLKEAQDLLRQFLAGTLSSLALPQFLKNWLIPHIQGTDRKYSAALRRQGIL